MVRTLGRQSNGNLSRQANQLIRVDMCRRDCGHKSNSPFHAIPKVSRIIHISAVVVMGVDEGIDGTHHTDSMLKAS